MSQYESLKSLIDHLDESSVAYLDYKTDSEHIVISKEVPKHDQTSTSQVIAPVAPVQTQVVDETSGQTSPKQDQVTPSNDKDILSPMVGVAYLQPEPEADVYVTVGDQVKKGDTVCIIEAMKLMNEIEAPEDGIITQILVDNEEVVEYNQPLMRYEPVK